MPGIIEADDLTKAYNDTVACKPHPVLGAKG